MWSLVRVREVDGTDVRDLLLREKLGQGTMLAHVDHSDVLVAGHEHCSVAVPDVEKTKVTA